MFVPAHGVRAQVQLGGKHTVCRLHAGDETGDGGGQASTSPAKTLIECERQCEALASCVAVEFRPGHCEKWLVPPRATANRKGSNYECWLRAHVANDAAHSGSGRRLASLAVEFRSDTLGAAAPRRSTTGPVIWQAVYPPGLQFVVDKPSNDPKTNYGQRSVAPVIVDHQGTGLSWSAPTVGYCSDHKKYNKTPLCKLMPTPYLRSGRRSALSIVATLLPFCDPRHYSLLNLRFTQLQTR
jgi:hypothetical protein